MNNIMMQAFEWYLPDDGAYYQKLQEQAKELKEKGIDAVWLPPMYKATASNDVGYGIYDLYDLGEFDQKGTVRTKYGTKEELKRCIDVLHEHGIKVYADVVLNHKAAADYTETFQAVEVDPSDRTKDITEPMEVEGWTGFNFPKRHGKYSDFVWNFNHFNGIDYDARTEHKGIFRILGENKYWNMGVSDEKGNYDYLMFADIDHSHPDVVAEIYRWSEWLLETLPLDGFRFDALKHINDDFIVGLIKHIESFTDRELYFFGEFWMYGDSETNEYLYETKYHMDLFDVALHYHMEQAAKDRSYDMRKIFDNTIVQEHPTLAVTFVDNHDSEPGQALESFVDPWFKKIAYGLILLRKDGYPCIFYGDYYGIGGEHPVEGQQEMIDNLMWIRKNCAYGDQTDYMQEKDLIGWVRHGDEKHPVKLAVVISTGDMNTMSMFVGEEESGKKYRDMTGGNTNEITIDEHGYGAFEVGPGTMACWAAVKEG